MEFRDGGPAFPQSVAADALGGLTVSYDAQDGAGMSLRDWFAGQWLAGASAPLSHRTADAQAEEAYEIANAMIAEREKQS